MLSSNSPAVASCLLVLADGSRFLGHSIGATGASVGELVFNTSLTGYQEILTDPSYCRQIVTLTYPHIGNYGVNAADAESEKVQAAGLVVRQVPAAASNFRSEQRLQDYLVAQQCVGIAGIDTRRLTRILRTSGAQNACLLGLESGETVTEAHWALALSKAQSAPSMAGQDLAKVVSRPTEQLWTEGEWRLGEGFKNPSQARFHVVAYDFGVKRNILRMLADRGCKVTVVPAQTPASRVFDLEPDGVFLSNGPGDPEPCEYAIAATRALVDAGLPTFGICLGHQILALASGARTYKMKFGHHGANHPVKDLDSGRVSITSQNHGFAVDTDTLPANLRATHVSLFDSSLQGIARTDKPAFSFQGHPEASPGPHDIGYLFDRFVALMAKE
ncbi:glutamine-hydrolyzing carbamoyl-phosphate synthase small subunit [Inhella gelatinilytica]|uniref:Carbamoyl phosphate synthase small chain n=1 Tax=Inhella gelatinilytica TaxID=2795030 RepID=A0A931IYD6_9BURK|nr:glutamine-hydrolyzing carbamoyl-phosphate synthase small subunit [Inhella gelatinilytica]MBH9553349.1 glutamine-hydrolyzing carbamoyl-phosphate synthase small subunit [Inhella gelatinilytica]